MAVRDDFTAGEVLAAADLNDTFASKLDLAGGKILQIVRATDGTDRSTSSTSYVDAGNSVTITPQKSDSAIIVIASVEAGTPAGQRLSIAITDSSNNALSGATRQSARDSINESITAIGYSTPATTSATTYKLRFQVSAGTGQLNNTANVSQLYAIEVSA